MTPDLSHFPINPSSSTGSFVAAAVHSSSRVSAGAIRDGHISPGVGRGSAHVLGPLMEDTSSDQARRSDENENGAKSDACRIVAVDQLASADAGSGPSDSVELLGEADGGPGGEECLESVHSNQGKKQGGRDDVVRAAEVTQ